MAPYVSEYRFLLSVAPGFESKLGFFILGQSEFFFIRTALLLIGGCLAGLKLI